MDCIIGMKEFPDKYFELAIVDPNYGIGEDGAKNYTRSTLVKANNYKPYIGNDLKAPGEEYFKELIRVSKNQVIWGVNYYDVNLKGGRIIWDKCNGNNDFSDCEIAYCSMHNSVRMFRYMWAGMMQGKNITEGYIMQGNKKLNEVRIHPNQKPVNLYKWLLQQYAKPGDKILDTHVGSASSLISCHDMGFKYVGFELDNYYYKLASRRLEEHEQQLSLFSV